MPSRRCVKCGSSWGSNVVKCAFCGGESEVEAEPVADQMPEFLRKTAGPETAPETLLRPDVGTAVAVEPTPPSGAPAAEPLPETTEDPDEDAPRPIFEITPMPPPCPRVPSPTPLLVFGLGGIAAAGVLLPALLGGNSFFGGFALLLCGLFAPFAPIAWIGGLKYERRCRTAGVDPHLHGTAARQLGLVGMALITFELGFASIVLGIFRLAGV